MNSTFIDSIFVRAAAFGLAYWLTVTLAIELVSPIDKIALFWPPNAIAIAVLIFSSRKHWPLYLIAMALAYFSARVPAGHLPLYVYFGFCAANIIEVLIVAEAVKRLIRTPITHDILTKVLPVAMLASVPASIASALIGGGFVTLAIEKATFWKSSFGWFTGDLLGLLLVLPVLLAWFAPGTPLIQSYNKGKMIERAAITAIFVAIGLSIPAYLAAESQISLIFPYLVFPVLVWTAIRTGVRSATVATLAVGLFAIGLTYLGQGPFKIAGLSEFGQVIEMKVGLITIALTTILLSTVVAGRKLAEKKTQRHILLLQIMDQMRTNFIESKNVQDVFDHMLTRLLEFTDSEYGFIGEVYQDAENQPYLKTLAISNIAWNEETRQFYEENAPEGMEFRNLDSLFGQVMVTEKMVIANDPANDPRAGGRPEGHPALNAFLGIPLQLGPRFSGMVGIANRPGGYTEDIINEVRPLLNACESIIQAHRAEVERLGVEESLKESKEAAEKANNAKSDFLSSMSHEFRTPLNAILGFTQLLNTDPDHPLTENQLEATGQVLNSGDHLLNLIEDVLDLAAIEAGKVSLDPMPHDPSTAIKNCTAIATTLAEQKGLTFNDRTVGWNLPKINIDETRFQQVLLNLLSNAVKYNQDDGTVALAIEESESGALRFSIIDTGTGIPEEKHDQIFTPFSRLGLENSDITGTGIGLSITRELTEAMGGTIGFESTLNLGSTFWVAFPIVSGQLLERGPNDVLADADGSLLTNRTVLCVEDNPSSLKLLESIIKRIPDTAMISAHTGELGVDLAKIHRPDVILMDINLPGISGLEALQRLKKSTMTKNIPVIALTARASANDRKEGLDQGFEHYLSKPFKLDEITTTLIQVLSGD